MDFNALVLQISLAFSFAVSIGLAFVALRFRTTAKGIANAFIGMAAAGGWWILCYAIELNIAEIGPKLVFAKLRYIGIVSLPLIWMLFTALFTRQGNWVNARSIFLLSIMPLITLSLMFTTEIHGLVWRTLAIRRIGNFSVFISDSGLWFWVHSAYSYGLMTTGFIFIARAFIRSPRTYRRQLVPLGIAIVAPWVGNAITIFGFSPIDITPFAFTVTAIALAWTVFRLNLLSVIPIARDSVMENIQDGVVVVNAQNQIIDLNPMAQTLISAKREQSLGKPLQEVWPALSIPKHVGSLRQEVQSKVNGAPRFLEANSSQLLGQQAQVLGSVIIIHDVTDARLNEQQIRAQNEALLKANEALTIARQQAEEATRLKSEFLATMSHELRTPLNAIIGFTEILLEDMAGELTPEQRSYQSKILRNAEHLLSLINDVLDLARIEAGRVTLNENRILLRDWMNEIIGQINVLAERKNIAFEDVLDPQLPPYVIGDALRLKQIAINLLSNAVKFTETGKVRFEVMRVTPTSWKIEVCDTGIGIPDHLHEVIFQEFRQADSSSTRAHGGTGLGLAIVNKLVLLMRGTVRLKSQVGVGSTFTVTLPLNDGSSASSS